MTIVHVPIRTCLGCGQQRPKGELVRVCVQDGVLTIDDRARLSGRGGYLCRQQECVNRLIKKRGRLSAALRASLPREKEEGFLRGLWQAWGGEGKG
jgi:predicted RNA-binding protein YlxR (DUF448 family)